ncbi:V-ATPase_G domain-containing protein [Cephalotus follicularis]|uniref:V-type proton ATPase subunit G n=1 Tax=Cephalotus follicularis TaxID=3775 RepID=A0A1Q3AV62_CEPFO|nr:V-ATPase_G domain-containing protein [Cephalotus follicularis]
MCFYNFFTILTATANIESEEIRGHICLKILSSSTVAMDPFRGQGGIQMLLTAEQDAQHIVSSARNLKIARLKQAKEEAERDAAVYRSNMEAEYQKNMTESSGSSDSTVKRLEEETEIKIKNLKESASSVSKDVVSMLMKYVTNVKV